jgi:VanZ family protein
MTEHQKFAARWRARIKRAAFWCFWPAVAVVAWGELAGPQQQEFPDFLVWDKAQHFTAYFGLALLATLGWGRRIRASVILGAVLLLGGVLEILQAFLGRDAQWADMGANTLGAVLGLGLGFLMLRAARLVDARRGD